MTEAGVLNQSTPFQAYIEGAEPSCFNTPSGSGQTVTVTAQPAPSTTFSYPSTCTGTGQSFTAMLFIQDPAMGDNVSQVVSIIPATIFVASPGG